MSNFTTTFSPTVILDDKNCSRLDLSCINNALENNNSSIGQLFAVIAAAFVWFLYLTYYNSRLLGYLLSHLGNYSIPNDKSIYIGSFSISVLSGKLMFRDILYVTQNYSLHISDGYVIIKWWSLFSPKQLQKESELSDQDTRLKVYLTNYQLYVYNVCEKYEDLKEAFRSHDNISSSESDKNLKDVVIPSVCWWRTLFPSFDTFISDGSITFGNNHLPNSLLVSFTESHFRYKTTKASNQFDIFMHVVDGEMGSLSISLIPSCNFDSKAKVAFLDIQPPHICDPPRKMGEGYCVMRSTSLKIKVSYDEPGEDQAVIEEDVAYMQSSFLSDDIQNVPDPVFDIFITCEKRTSLNYGPWADRQRDLLQKFFFPPTYQNHQFNSYSGSKIKIRQTPMINFSINFLHQSDLDILFMTDDQIRVFNINSQKGSFIDISFPLLIGPNGYETLVLGQLLHADVSTNMEYRYLLNAETLRFKFISHYPLVWNDVIHYKSDLTITKVSLNYIFSLNHFFSDLINDWTRASTKPDVCTFVPYVFTFRALMEDVELLLPCNSYNWVDTEKNSTENELLALHSKQLVVEFSLPFNVFCPPTYTLPVVCKATGLHLCLHMQTSNPSWYSLLNLSSSQANWKRNAFDFSCCTSLVQTLGADNLKDEWVNCWQIPQLNLTIKYTWHSSDVDLIDEKPNWDFTLLEKKYKNKNSGKKIEGNPSEECFLQTHLPAADILEVDLDISKSCLLLYGPLLKLLINAKEDYLGANDVVTDVQNPEDSSDEEDSSSSESSELIRPLDVIAIVKLENTSGYLPVYPNPSLDQPPKVSLKSLYVDVTSRYLETVVKLILDDLEINFSEVDKDLGSFQDDLSYDPKQDKGKVHLNKLFFNLSAYLSDGAQDTNFPVTEYACMTAVDVGDVTAKLSVPEMLVLSDWVDLFTSQYSNKDYQLKMSKYSIENLLKSKMELRYVEIHLTVNLIDVMLCVSDSFIFQLKIPTISICDVIGCSDVASLTPLPLNTCPDHPIHNEVGSVETIFIQIGAISLINNLKDRSSSTGDYVETGRSKVGPIFIHISIPLPSIDLVFRQKFLLQYDRSTRRIPNLWKEESRDCRGSFHTDSCFLLLPCTNFNAFQHSRTSSGDEDSICEKSGSDTSPKTASTLQNVTKVELIKDEPILEETEIDSSSIPETFRLQSAFKEIKQDSSSSSELYYSAESDVEDLNESHDSPVMFKTSKEPHLEAKQTNQVHRQLFPDLPNEPPTQRPVTLKLLDHLKPKAQKMTRNDHQRAHSIDMLGGSGAYESGSVEELASAYKKLLTVSQLKRMRRNSPGFKDKVHWMPYFEIFNKGIYFPDVIRTRKDQNESIRQKRCLVQKIHLQINIEKNIEIQITPILLLALQRIIKAVEKSVETSSVTSIINKILSKCLSKCSDQVTERKTKDLWKELASCCMHPPPEMIFNINIRSLTLVLIQAGSGSESVFSRQLQSITEVPCFSSLIIRLNQLTLASRQFSAVKTRENEAACHPLSGSFSVENLDCQLRILTHDGFVPDVISITSLTESCSNCNFRVGKLPADRLLPSQLPDHKPFGWLMLEVGMIRIRSDFAIFRDGIPPFNFSPQSTSGSDPNKESELQRFLTDPDNCGIDINLTIQNIWSNLASKSHLQTIRPGALQWNSVTSLAVTCHAWMTPLDRLSHAIRSWKLNEVRRNLEVCSASFVSILIHLPELRKITEKSKSPDLILEDDKHNITTPHSKRLRRVFSFRLISIISRCFVLHPDVASSVESALKHVTAVPRLVTLRPAIFFLIALLHKRILRDEDHKKSKHYSLHRVDDVTLSALTDIEQLDHGNQQKTDLATLYGVLFNCITSEESESRSSSIFECFLREGFTIKFQADEIGIHKHRCDERVFKSRMQRNKHQSSMSSSWSNDPVLLCPCIQWKKSDLRVPGRSSYEDLIVLLWLKVAIEFDSIKKIKSNQEFQLEDETDPQKDPEVKTEVVLKVSSSFICQNIDSTIFHLIHEGIETFSVLCEMQSEMEVRKFRGRLSANTSVRINDHSVSSSYHRRISDQRSPLGTLRDPFDLTADLEDEAMYPFWRIIYKLVDENCHILEEEGRYEDGTFCFRYPETDSLTFQAIYLTANCNIEKVEILASVEDFKVILKLSSIGAKVFHEKVEFQKLISFKYNTKANVKVDGICVECKREMRNYSSKVFITACIGYSLANMNMCMDNSNKLKSSSQNFNDYSLNISKIEIELCEHLGSLCDELLNASSQISSQSQRFFENKFVVSKDAVKNLASPLGGQQRFIDSILFAFTPAPNSANTSFPKEQLPRANEEVFITSIFRGVLDEVQVSLAILPSVVSKYQAKNLELNGESYNQSNYNFSLPEHALVFHVKNTLNNKSIKTAIPLPGISSNGRIHKVTYKDKRLGKLERDDIKISFHLSNHEQTVTTDLVNQLIFLKTLCTNEIQDLVDKMSKFQRDDAAKSEIPISAEQAAKRTVYHVDIQLEGIQLTVTTPSNNAVRLKTSKIIFEFSNSIQREERIPKYLTLFGKADIDMSVALGSFMTNSVYAEAEPEFQQTGYFTTRISLKNSSQSPSDSENVSRVTIEDSEQLSENTILISLIRPIFFVQPTAFDKAILIFVAYKTAYEKWLEKNKYLRDNLNKSKVTPPPQSQDSKSSTSVAHFFLQLSVYDLGVCLPIPDASEKNGELILSDELSLAMVMTIDEATISACIAKSIVTQGDFSRFCLRFVNDFQPTLDDWTLDISFDPAADEINNQFDFTNCCYGVTINALSVPEGSYKICTDTSSYHVNTDDESAKVRNCISVVWMTKGMSLDVDYKIGGYISRLVHMLTSITGRENLNLDLTSWENNTSEGVDDLISIPDLSRKNSMIVRSNMKNKSSINEEEMVTYLQNEYQQQCQVVKDLRELGAKAFVLDNEINHLHKIEKQLAQCFRVAVTNHFKGKDSFSISRSSSNNRTLSRFGTLRLNDRNRTTTFQDEMSRVDEEDSDPKIQKLSDVSTEEEQQLDTDIETVLNIRVEMEEGKIVCHHEMPLKEREALEKRKRYKFVKYLCDADKENSFFVPGVKMRLHYGSAHGLDGKFDLDKDSTHHKPSPPTKNSDAPKKGLVCIWLYIQSLPKSVIHPHFLDFLERMLSLLPLSSLNNSSDDLHPEDKHSDPGMSSADGFDLEMTSLPVDVMAYLDVQPSEIRFTCLPSSHVECWIQIPRLDVVFSNTTNFSNPDPKSSSLIFNKESAIHGMCFTAVFSDFSVKIYHLYGAQPPMETNFTSSNSPNHTKIRDFTVSLEVIKFNFVRTRKLVTKSLISSQGDQKMNKFNQIDVSLLIDVGKATIIYDVMKLNEIFCIPQAWFKKSLARRLFFGDERSTMTQNNRRGSKGGKAINDIQPKSSSEMKVEKEKTPWEGCVVCQVNMSVLEVYMSMGNVMGKTLFICRGFSSKIIYNTYPNHDKMIEISFTLNQASLTAHSGVAGGNVVMSGFMSHNQISSSLNKASQHRLDMQMKKIYGNVDHFGRRIMMGQLTDLQVSLKDHWNLTTQSNNQPTNRPTGFPEKNQISIPVHFSWDRFWLAIHRSTTPDVMKMTDKLYQFFEMQIRNSLNAFTPYTSMMSGDSSSTQSRFKTYSPLRTPILYNTRHWHEVYDSLQDTINILRDHRSSILRKSSSQFIFGGSVTLEGNFLTIACFHGSYFERSSTWLLFNIRKPVLQFETEVQQFQESIDDTSHSTFCLQKFIFHLGDEEDESRHPSQLMSQATVCKLTKNKSQQPPPFTPDLEEWYNYLNVSPDAQEVGLFHQALDQTRETFRSFSSVSDNKSKTEFGNQVEMIAGLPRMQFDFKSSHTQAPDGADINAASEDQVDGKDKANIPVVDCSFVADFSDHLSVTMNVELLMFVHEVIKLYWEERLELYRSSRKTSNTSTDQLTFFEEALLFNEGSKSSYAEKLKNKIEEKGGEPVDMRVFNCNDWQLEPSFRLISWGGFKIEPMGVDYVLSLLGFQKARTTIPKWLQRGALDPLDKGIALGIKQLILSCKPEKQKKPIK